MEIIIKTLSDERDKAREVVEAIIDSEQNYLFTNDLDYKENKTSIMTDLNSTNNSNQRGNVEGGGPGG
jgi:hypothetical protein